jgi:hypothetical protein
MPLHPSSQTSGYYFIDTTHRSVKLTTTLHLIPGLRTLSNSWRGALAQGGTVFLVKQADQILVGIYF